MAQQCARQEAKERELKERMTLYKGTLEDEDLGDDEPQVEPARIPLTLKITNETTFGMVISRPRRKPQLYIILG